MRHTARPGAGKLTSLVVEGPVEAVWEYSPQGRQRMTQAIRTDMQSSLSSMVNALIEGTPLDSRTIMAQTTSAMLAKFINDYHKSNQPIRWYGRVTVRVGNPFPMDGVLARGRIVDSMLREIELAVAPRRPRPPLAGQSGR